MYLDNEFNSLLIRYSGIMKVYLDTSVISHLKHDDAPEKMKDTLVLWRLFEQGEYDVYLSTLTLEEVDQCPEPKRQELFNFLEKIEYTLVDITEDISDLATQIIDMGILSAKSFDDCQHIAAAVINDCDCIISWNFKHLVNLKTIRGVRAITNLKGYRVVEIVTPSVMIESEG